MTGPRVRASAPRERKIPITIPFCWTVPNADATAVRNVGTDAAAGPNNSLSVRKVKIANCGRFFYGGELLVQLPPPQKNAANLSPWDALWEPEMCQNAFAFFTSKICEFSDEFPALHTTLKLLLIILLQLHISNPRDTHQMRTTRDRCRALTGGVHRQW